MKIEEGIILIVKKENKFLLLKRAKEPFKGILEFPTGKVEEKNSSMEHAAWRELQEKTSLYPSKLEYLGSLERKEKDKILIFHVFLVEKFAREIKLSSEHSEFCWLAKKEILERRLQVNIDSITILKKFKDSFSN
jgi:ADP-ribose pyrophosphatase YjhB (NUDIX family)